MELVPNPKFIYRLIHPFSKRLPPACMQSQFAEFGTCVIFSFQCETVSDEQKFFMPMKSPYYQQMKSAVGIGD